MLVDELLTRTKKIALLTKLKSLMSDVSLLTVLTQTQFLMPTPKLEFVRFLRIVSSLNLKLLHFTLSLSTFL